MKRESYIFAEVEMVQLRKHLTRDVINYSDELLLFSFLQIVSRIFPK